MSISTAAQPGRSSMAIMCATLAASAQQASESLGQAAAAQREIIASDRYAALQETLRRPR